MTSIATSDAKQKMHANGKLTARERIYALLDDDSFVELDALARNRSSNFGLERALDWQPGSIDMILAGGEPTEDGVEEPLLRPAELVEELGRRLGRVRVMAQPQPIPGFGGEPASVSENEATLNLSGPVAVVPSS